MSSDELNEYSVPESNPTPQSIERENEFLYQSTIPQDTSSGHLSEPQKGANGLSIAGFVVSLVSLFILAMYGITGTVGLILSAVGRSQAVSEERKTGLATAGIVLGIISIMGGIVNAFIFL